MTVYVDDAFKRGTVGGLTAQWSHLIADSDDELAAFALELGLRPEWLRFSGRPEVHYLVTQQARARAFRLGAKPVTFARAGEIVAGKRAAAVPPAVPVEDEPAPAVEADTEPAGGGRAVPRWNPARPRHRWKKIREHWDRCVHCDLASENELVDGKWVRWWHWPSGDVTVDVLTPPCPGPPNADHVWLDDLPA